MRSWRGAPGAREQLIGTEELSSRCCRYRAAIRARQAPSWRKGGQEGVKREEEAAARSGSRAEPRARKRCCRQLAPSLAGLTPSCSTTTGSSGSADLTLCPLRLEVGEHKKIAKALAWKEEKNHQQTRPARRAPGREERGCWCGQAPFPFSPPLSRDQQPIPGHRLSWRRIVSSVSARPHRAPVTPPPLSPSVEAPTLGVRCPSSSGCAIFKRRVAFSPIEAHSLPCCQEQSVHSEGWLLTAPSV
ncbi:uncharacterized protein LOC136013376 [Lathamus discolor]|uniref:uncharacterized protein LOC136013376 n=1 Tax=Lathamus discolor TaxID=678569 RepID=UPI0032B806B8